MKKLILLLIILSATNGLFSQTCDDTLPITENFDTADVINVCWNLSDQDNDGNNWYWKEYTQAYGGYKCLASNEWTTSQGYLNPDNWIYSYAIDLTSYSNSDNIQITWKVRGELAEYSHINYSVYAATTNQISDFENSPYTLTEFTDEIGGAGNFVTRSINISGLAGNFIYIAFRHKNTSGTEYLINIDDVSVSTTLGIGDIQQLSFNHYYDNNSNILTLNSQDTPIDKIEIYNILGQSILSKELNQTEEKVNLSILNDGIYIAKVRINAFVKTIKFIKK